MIIDEHSSMWCKSKTSARGVVSMNILLPTLDQSKVKMCYHEYSSPSRTLRYTLAPTDSVDDDKENLYMATRQVEQQHQ